MGLARATKAEVSEEPQSSTRRGRRREPSAFSFQDVNLSLLWSRLALTATQLAGLTGLTRRQVEWWRRRGYLPPSPQSPGRFSGDAVTLALLMRQGVEAGHQPGVAYQLAIEHLARRLAAGLAEAAAANPNLVADPAALLELQERLLATHNTIGLVLSVIAPLVRRVEQERESDTENDTV